MHKLFYECRQTLGVASDFVAMRAQLPQGLRPQVKLSMVCICACFDKLWIHFKHKWKVKISISHCREVESRTCKHLYCILLHNTQERFWRAYVNIFHWLCCESACVEFKTLLFSHILSIVRSEWCRLSDLVRWWAEGSVQFKHQCLYQHVLNGND